MGEKQVEIIFTTLLKSVNLMSCTQISAMIVDVEILPKILERKIYFQTEKGYLTVIRVVSV